MKKFARLLSMVLAVATVLSLCIGAFDYVDADKITKGKENAINAVYDWGIMQGNDKGEFNPTANLTRDEMSKIMYAMKEIGLDVPSYFTGFASTFADGAKVPAWSKGYVGYAYIYNIFVGNEKNEINALGNLSYVEATIVLLRAMGFGTSEDNNGKTIDRYTGANWMINAIADGATAGLFNGLDISSFTAAITREDVAVMIYNAVDSVGENYFKLAEKVEGVVIGTETDDKKVDYFTLSNGEKYEIGDLDVADYMGKKVSFCVEDKKVVSAITTSATVVNTTVGETGLDDDEEYVTVGKDNFIKYEDVDAIYLFMNNTKEGVLFEGNFMDAWDYEYKNNGFQKVTLINNGNSMSIVYNPVTFKESSEISLEREVNDKGTAYTGKYKVSGTNYYWPTSTVEKNVWYVLSVEGNEVVIEGTLKTISVSDISASLKKSKYTFTYKGEKMTVNRQVDGSLTEKGLFDTIAGSKKYNALVYGNVILKLVEVEEDPKVELVKYAYILDVTETASNGSKVYVVEALIGAMDVETFVVKSAAIEGEPNIGELYKYNTKEEDGDGLKKGDVVLSDSRTIELGAWDKTNFKASDYDNKKTVVLYNKDLKSYVAASTLVVEEGVIKLDGFEIPEGALKYYEDSDYIYIQYATK